MRNWTETDGPPDEGRVTDAAVRLVSNLFPFRLVEREGEIVGCWFAEATAVDPATGSAAGPALRGSMMGLLRTVDGRVVGHRFTTRLGPAANLAALRRLSDVSREDDAEARWASHLTFVKGMRCLQDRLGPSRSASGPAPYLLAAGDTLTRVLGWKPDDRQVAVACARWSHVTARRIGRFLGTFDHRVLRLVTERTDLDDLLGEVWAGLDRTFQPDVPLWDALTQRPQQGRLLLRTWKTEPDAVRVAVRTGALDGLVGAALVREGTLPRSLVRRLEEVEQAVEVSRIALDTSPAGEDVHGRAVAITSRLMALPSSMHPVRAEDWVAFDQLRPVLDGLDDWRGPRGMRSALLGGQRRWTTIQELLSRAAGTHDMTLAMGRLDAMVRSFAAEVLMPAAARASGGAPDVGPGTWTAWHNAAHVLLLSGHTLRSAFTMSVAWERGFASRSSRVDPPDPSRWPAYLPDCRYHRILLRVLDDSASLTRALPSKPTHLGSPYRSHRELIAACRLGRTRFVSVCRQDEAGRWSPLSIAEVHVLRRPLSVAMHVGIDGARPDQDAVNALWRYAGDLHHGSLAVDDSAFQRPRVKPSLSVLCGYEWRSEASWREVRRVWKRFVPRTLSDASERQISDLVRDHARPGPKHWLTTPLPLSPPGLRCSPSRAREGLTPPAAREDDGGEHMCADMRAHRP